MNIEFPMGLQLPSGYTEIEKGTNKLEQDGFTSNQSDSQVEEHRGSIERKLFWHIKEI